MDMKKAEAAIWVAKSLFNRGKTSGSTANISFLDGDTLYISASGTCFGTLKAEDFAQVELSSGRVLTNRSPSKELPLHMQMYRKDRRIKAVIHTHSYYSTLWSCLPNHCADDAVPTYTPYLQMKLGAVKMVPYAPPGSEELFRLFEQEIDSHRGYLLANHGPIVGDEDILRAFYCLEELEESCHIAWELRKENVSTL